MRVLTRPAFFQGLGDDQLDLLISDLPGAPGRGSSPRPSSRDTMNRPRHLRTVSRETPRSAATAVTDAPSALASTIRDRNASACDVFRRRAHPSRTCRSPALSTSGSNFGLGMRDSLQAD